MATLVAAAAIVGPTLVSSGGGGDAAPKAPPADRSQSDISQALANKPSTIDYRRLDERLQRLMQEDDMVALAVGVVEHGQIRFLKGYGETFEGSGQPVNANTVFRWASVSKGVAADMVAKLADENKLSLYEPIAKYSASLRLPGGNEHKATVADVLSHRLGLFGHAQDSKLEDGMDARMLRANLATLNAICPPSTCHAYQNVAYDAASDVVEKVTGKSYQEAVREQLFLPLGMTTANMSREALLSSPNWARPHRGGSNPKPVEVTDSYYRVPAAGGVNSSIKDLAIWMQAQMGLEPKVLSPRALESVQSPRAVTGGELGRMRKFRERLNKATYGLGWRIYNYAGYRAVGHRGGVTGYRSLIMFDPDRKSGVVALWNTGTNQPSGVQFEVMDMIYQLPQRDWLDLDKLIERPPAQPEEVTDGG
nr:serine hydrolase domain-containing protein [uncultured Sphingosinicella sp.]